MKTKRHQLTKAMIKQLKDELDYLTNDARKKIADDLDWLRSQPTNEDDSPFSGILEDKSVLEKRISEIKSILDNAEIVNDDVCRIRVEVGSKVEVAFDRFQDEYFIVDSLEADPLHKKISAESPIGKALIGAKVGDTVSVEIAGTKKTFRVLSIS